MNTQRFAQLVATYGGTPKRWPTEEHDAALVFLQQSTSARETQQEALQLDRLLDMVPIVEPSAALRKRIMAATYSEPVQDFWSLFVQWLLGSTWTQHVWRPAIALLLPLLLGIILGFTVITPSQSQTVAQTTETVDWLALGSTNLMELP